MLICLILSNSFVSPWTVAHKTPLSKGFSRQEYWCGLPFISPGDFPDPGIELVSLALADDSLLLSHQGSPGIMSIILAILHIFFLPLFIFYLFYFLTLQYCIGFAIY